MRKQTRSRSRSKSPCVSKKVRSSLSGRCVTRSTIAKQNVISRSRSVDSFPNCKRRCSRSPRRKSPRRKSPRRKSPKRKSPKRKSPKRKSPGRKSPNRSKSPKRKGRHPGLSRFV